MANEVTTDSGSSGELVTAEIISSLIIDAAYDVAVMPPLVRVEDITNQDTLTAKFTKWPLLAATDLTEATDAANTPVNTSAVSVAADEAGIMVTVTDMLESAAVADLSEYAEELGKALANKIDTDILAEVADFTTSVGTTTVDLTEAVFLEAIFNLELGTAVMPYVSVLHPIQVNDLRNSLSSSTASLWSTTDHDDIGAMANLYGVDIVKSNNCASVNTNADRQGVMMPLGNRSGLAYVVKKLANTELQRDASLRATEIVVTAVYGDECVNTDAKGGVKIISDHE